VTARRVVMVLSAAVLVGGGVALASAQLRGTSEPRDLSRALAALERQERALARLERRRDPAPQTVVVTAPEARDVPAAPAAPVATAATPIDSAAVEPSSEQLEAEVRARAIVERAASGGQWGDAELSSFRAQFHELTPAQQGSVLQSISLAINEGRFRPDPTRLPF
jgi:hypothetical protein